MFNIEEATIADIQNSVKSREISYKELVIQYFERIAEFDSCKNGLNSIIEINPDAIQIAEQLDNDRNLKATYSLYGIPILLKDNVNTADKMRTCAGSLALADNFAVNDATVALSLRKSGALFLGKANMTEYANFMAYDMPAGYSSRGGQVIHPYLRESNPCGSSTGSAAAVAANLCVASVGTETCGSVIAPSFACGIVGIKPTAGLLSGNGIIPISNTLDTAGAMARTVTDAAILLGAMEYEKDYTHDLELASLKNLRVGIYGIADETDEYYNIEFERVLTEMEKAGALVIRDICNTISDNSWQEFGKVIAVHEFKHSLEYYLSTAHSKMKSFKDIVMFNIEHNQQCLKYGQSMLLECLEVSGRLIESEYLQALRRRDIAIKDLNQIFDENKFDILLYAGKFSSIAPTTGFPAGVIPIGLRENGVPYGLYFFARPFAETTLIRAMYAAEQLVGQRFAPKLKKN